LLARPPATAFAESPQIIDTGVYVLNVGRLDTTIGAYTVDFYLHFKCDQP
jgi:hypothetical protein